MGKNGNGYENWDKKDLIAEIKSLKQRKKFGLVWENKPEEVVDRCGKELPVLEEVKSLALNGADDAPTNLLIEGDNYHSLAVLNYTHRGKIDVIYIDPPYNTGARDWKYNNDYVDANDGYRHSKFASFVYNRMAMAKPLLSPRGIFICAIDDYEVQNMRHILDDIFGEECRLATIVVVHKPGGRQDDRFFATAHEYMLVYAKNLQRAEIGFLDATEKKLSEFKYEDQWGKYKLREYRRSGANSRREDRPNMWYPIYINPKTLQLSVHQTDIRNAIKLLPVDPQGIERVWRWSADTLMRDKEQYIEVKKNGNGIGIHVKERAADYRGQKPTTLWNESRYSSVNGTDELKSILGREFNGNKIFDYPKSKFLVRDILAIASAKKSIVLDFFAGSGTTAQSVVELNKTDGGSRSFILCTNNEDNNGDRKKIARDICYPRIKNVMRGYTTPSDVRVDGIGGNLKYFKTTFVVAAPADPNKLRLTEKAADMICVKEGTFAPVKETKAYKIFRDGGRYTAIVYDYKAIPQIKKFAAQTDGKFAAYIFSLADDDFADEFADMRDKIQTRAIPEAILRVYRRIFKREENHAD